MPSGVKVCIRTRPTATFAQDNIIVHDDGCQLTVKMPKGDNPNAQDSWSWKYDAVLHNSAQATVYDQQAFPIVQSVLAGYNGSIMCYGQTGAGKTFTQVGSSSFKDRGIIPRAIGDIFNHFNNSPQYEWNISVSYVEIHNDTLVDLLSTLPTSTPTLEPLSLTEDKHGATSVKGLRCEPAIDEETALSLHFEGNSNRQTANHELNRNSTRGHAIFTVHIKYRSRVDSAGVVTKCKLNLVDLAGSERLKKTATDGELRSESMYINRSLTYLEQVVVALSSKGRSHTPYRQSKLTHLLKDSLGGNSKTLLIANVYGEAHHLEETISTLQFAARVRLVPNEATINEEHDPEQLLKKYSMEIADLKAELAMHDSLASRDSRVTYEPYSDQQRVALLEDLQSYLDSEDQPGEGGKTEIEIESVRQIRELLAGAKKLYGKQSEELSRTREELEKHKEMLRTGTGYVGGGGGGEGGEGGMGGGGGGEGEPVGEADAGAIAAGLAPDDARPAGGLVDPPFRGEGVDGGEEMAAGGFAAIPAGLDRNEAYTLFKRGEGLAVNNKLMAAKREANKLKERKKELAKEANEHKSEIDRLGAGLHQKQLERESTTVGLTTSTSSGGELIIDEEEYRLIQELKLAKQNYRTAHGGMVEAALSLKTYVEEMDSARTELLKQFDEWYAANFPDAPQTTSFPAPPARTPSPTKGAGGDTMDEDEQFEAMQLQRVMQTHQDPTAAAFFSAKKATAGKKKGIARR